MKTRDFNFPNGGHSVRKLVAELAQFGSNNVRLSITGDRHSQVVSFNDGEYANMAADKLAKKLVQLGTRFTVNITARGHMQLEFHTKFEDIRQYPDVYL